MKKLWHRFLFWLYEDFLTFFFEREHHHLREHLRFLFEHTESEIEVACSRMIHVFSERASFLEKQNQEIQKSLDEHDKSFEDFRKQTEARFAQIMALWYGKTPHDWDSPPSRPPRDFTYEDRQ